MMTEDEARTKWCPFARDSNTAGNRSLNTERGEREPAHLMCIASQCMAWRWAREPATFSIKGQRHAPSSPPFTYPPFTYEYDKEAGGKLVDPGSGYCGLGGKP